MLIMRCLPVFGAVGMFELFEFELDPLFVVSVESALPLASAALA